MKFRKETIDIAMHCDMKECKVFGKYTDDEGAYIGGWRYIAISIYDSFNDRVNSEVTMHVCPTCMKKFKQDD